MQRIPINGWVGDLSSGPWIPFETGYSIRAFQDAVSKGISSLVAAMRLARDRLWATPLKAAKTALARNDSES